MYPNLTIFVKKSRSFETLTVQLQGCDIDKELRKGYNSRLPEMNFRIDQINN